jgi:hypothetical protein
MAVEVMVGKNVGVSVGGGIVDVFIIVGGTGEDVGGVMDSHPPRENNTAIEAKARNHLTIILCSCLLIV